MARILLIWVAVSITATFTVKISFGPPGLIATLLVAALTFGWWAINFVADYNDPDGIYMVHT